jgi:hypothetical protein
MKKLALLMCLSLAISVFAGCGGSGTNTSNANGSGDATNTNATVATNTTTAAKTDLSPENVGPDKPVPAEELHNAVFAWEGKEVAVIGYPTFPRLIGSSVSLKGSADDSRDFKNHLVVCVSRQAFDNQEVDEKQPMVVKGTIKGYPTLGVTDLKVELKDCHLVSKGEFSGERGTANPTRVDVNKPIPAADLHRDFFKWQGKEVAVIGTYNGHTTSSNKGATIDIRIDVENGKGKKVVGCHISTQPGQDDFTERNNRVFKGQVAGSFFDQVSLQPCEYVKK